MRNFSEQKMACEAMVDDIAVKRAFQKAFANEGNVFFLSMSEPIEN